MVVHYHPKVGMPRSRASVTTTQYGGATTHYGWWSHDIGGHLFGSRDDELMARWAQFGVLSPINRLHSTEIGSKEPWHCANLSLAGRPPIPCYLPSLMDCTGSISSPGSYSPHRFVTFSRAIYELLVLAQPGAITLIATGLLARSTTIAPRPHHDPPRRGAPSRSEMRSWRSCGQFLTQQVD